MQQPQATPAELEAILHGAAIAPITDRAFLRITGSDATRWLNGMVTNNIQSLAPGAGNYNFLLNAHGRIQADCTIYREPHENEPTFLLEADSSQLEAVSSTLDRFIIMDDVDLSPALTDKLGFLLIGPKARLSLDTGLIWPPESTSISYASGVVDAMVLAMSEHMFEVWGDAEAAAWFQRSEREVSPAALEAFRIFSGTPRFGQDIRDRDLPQETNQTHALHFSKGCYLGQEIVERIRSRGQVHRQFTRFRLTGELPTTFPAPLTTADGKPAGELTSAAWVPLAPLPEAPQLFALGYARREFLEGSAAVPGVLTHANGTAIPRSASDTMTPTTDNRERTTETSHAR